MKLQGTSLGEAASGGSISEANNYSNENFKDQTGERFWLSTLSQFR